MTTLDKLKEPSPQNAWVSVETDLPPMGRPVWIYEPGHGIFIGARGDLGEGEWMWGHCYGDYFYSETSRGVGVWRTHTNETDDDYRPTHWMPLPEPPGVKP